jgi:hypothetical protein
MSHDGIWSAACHNRKWISNLHLVVLSVARGVTDVGVGSGAVLGRLFILTCVGQFRAQASSQVLPSVNEFRLPSSRDRPPCPRYFY